VRDARSGCQSQPTDDRTTAATTSDADPTASTSPPPTEAERETSAPDPALAECAERAQDILDEQGNDGEARRSADEAREACEAEIAQNPTETATPTPNGQSECLQDGDRRDAPPVDDERVVAVYSSCSPERGLIKPIVYRLDREIDDSETPAEARARAAFDAYASAPLPVNSSAVMSPRWRPPRPSSTASTSTKERSRSTSRTPSRRTPTLQAPCAPELLEELR
jgi:hypothetical protein